MSSRHVERVGSQTPTLLHLPDDRHDASRAEDLLEVAEIAGLALDEWQEFVLVESAWLRKPPRKNARSKWSANRIGVEVPRQNGKGTVKLVRQLTGAFVWHEPLQIHTAHLYPTCFEHFRKLVDIVENVPEFTAQLKPRTGVTSGSQNQAIELRNGCRIKFMARSGKSGRGLTADTVYLDEAFDVDAAMIGALEYALRARPNAQVWYTTSAPHAHSAFLHSLRRRARASGADEPRLLFMGWSNPADTDPGDRDAWYRVNPTLGVRVALETMEGEYRQALTDSALMAEFKREALGIPEGGDEGGWAVIPQPAWALVCVADDAPLSRIAYGLDVDEGRTRAAIVAAGEGREAVPVVEWVQSEEGTGWVAARFADITSRVPGAVHVDATGPASSLVPDLQAAGVTVVTHAATVTADASAAFYDDVADRKLKVRQSSTLDAAVCAARKHPIGSRYRWQRPDGGDPSLMAATLAHWGATRGYVEVAPPAFFDLADFLTEEG